MNNSEIRVLVVDDEEPIRRLLKKELSRKGFHTEAAEDGNAAIDILRQGTFDIILLDIVMPGIDGISLMKKLKADPQRPAIIVLTGKATVDTAVEAMKSGAYDYLTKPYKIEELILIIHRAYEHIRLERENRLLHQELSRKEYLEDFVGGSKQFMEMLSLIKKIAPTDSTVLIQGESGTGKELAANTIWKYSNRKNNSFIALNCSTLSENLLESELFGHEKGAFTNAYQIKHGLVEVADKGTLFLDEVGEISMGIQARLLRFLDSGEFRRVGSNKNLTVDVRVIAATNKSLIEAVKRGEFREDLFYRLNVINVTIPPLRERKEDIEELFRYFLRKYSQRLGKPVTDIKPEAMEMLNNYHWPGNVRELENVIERAVILCDSETIGHEDISINIRSLSKEDRPYSSLEDMERDYILKVLMETDGNQSRASRLLGIDRKTLYLKLKKYGIDEVTRKL